MGKKLSLIGEEISRARADFLLSDADMALTMLDLADETKFPENRARRRKEATKAYRTILRFIPRARLTHGQQATLEEKLCSIRERLRAKAA